MPINYNKSAFIQYLAVLILSALSQAYIGSALCRNECSIGDCRSE